MWIYYANFLAASLAGITVPNKYFFNLVPGLTEAIQLIFSETNRFSSLHPSLEPDFF